MSHVALVEIEVKDLQALKEACEALGLTLYEGQTTFKWFGQWVRDYHAKDAAYRTIDPKTFGTCEHAIGVKGNKSAYEIGVVKNPNGDGYRMIYDNWQGGYGLEKVAGKGLTKVSGQYAQEVAKKHMKAKGYTYQGLKTHANGTVEMTFGKY